ncbi:MULTISPECIES: hypothetical protein [Streptomyces]|uniref:hypothetical protein n=1 Tax=Streptomyces TaxID=1883 RepID=UPI001E2AA8FF|nr:MULTISPECIES: hypothetical protein [Streptomyces]UFQ17044.1 hypothetical protein J2N69_19685 [Streptomyces huasconensis]WCL86644.1 hypothetical protein PPN52_19690 [Streptomyces sp. JCM 35825]
MNTYNAQADWLPRTGLQLRKAGVQFDAVRVDGDPGRAVADELAWLTGGDPGPIVQEENGRRAVYFLVAVGSTSHRSWPDGVTRLTAGQGHVSYVPVPALEGHTWPLSWRYRPTGPDRRVHTLLLRAALNSHE